MAEIRHTQTTISNTLTELVTHIRGGAYHTRSPSAYPQSFHHQSPSLSSPSMSTPTVGHQQVNEMHSSPPGGSNSYPTSHGSIVNAPPSRPSRPSMSNPGYQSSSIPQTTQASPPGEYHPPQLQASHGGYHQGAQSYNPGPHGPQGPILPPFSSISSIQTMGPPNSHQSNVSSVRYQSVDGNHTHRPTGRHHAHSSKRAPPSSNVTSADSSDLDDEEDGELPASGLVAPWEVLRGLADVAIERAAKACSLIPLRSYFLTSFLFLGKRRQ